MLNRIIKLLEIQHTEAAAEYDDDTEDNSYNEGFAEGIGYVLQLIKEGKY